MLLEYEWVGGGKARRRGGFGCGWSGADLADSNPAPIPTPFLPNP